MTPSELKKNLDKMQKCSLALILSLASQNKDLCALTAAIDSGNEYDFRDSVKALGASCKEVADCLETYCSSSTFFIRGDWIG